MARGFMAAAAALSIGCFAAAMVSFLEGDLDQGLLLTAVSIFAAWMTTAVHQFQSRLTAIDEVVRQAQQRVERSDQTLSEMRQLANRLKSASAPEDGEEGRRTLH